MKNRYGVINYDLINKYIEAASEYGGHARFVSKAGATVHVDDMFLYDHFGNELYTISLESKDAIVSEIVFAYNDSEGTVIPLSLDLVSIGKAYDAFDLDKGTVSSERVLFAIDDYLHNVLEDLVKNYPCRNEICESEGINYQMCIN